MVENCKTENIFFNSEKKYYFSTINLNYQIEEEICKLTCFLQSYRPIFRMK